MRVLEAKSIAKSYHRASNTISVLRDVSLSLNAGDTLAITGASGVGKSSLLHCLGLLDEFDDGQLLLSDLDVKDLNPRELLLLRQEKIGFVFQFHYLMAELSALENVMLPLMIARHKKSHCAEQATKALVEVGLSERIEHKPTELSGGEQQRVAIARALVHEPKLIICDEPTGNLDTETESRVFDVLKSRAHDLNAALIVATHNLEIAAQMDRQVKLVEGRLVA